MLDVRNALRHGSWMLTIIAWSALVFALSVASKWLETRCVQAVIAWEGGDTSARERAARSELATFAVCVVALMTAVEVGWWVLVPEGAGVYFGTKLAMR